MCSIIGSYSKERLRHLAELNSYRGSHSHSLYVLDKDSNIEYSHRGFGPLVISDHPIADGDGRYFIAHQQAPTTEAKGEQSIHPAQINNNLLWHNGIIKEDDVQRLKELYGSNEAWDTRLLLMHYLQSDNVEGVDGTFACVLYRNNELHLFRNEISPLFYSEQGDISSTYFANSMALDENKVLTFDPASDNMFNVVAEFTTKENPYYFI